MLKNIFKTRKGLITMSGICFALGAYHLYLLGRCDEIKQIVDIAYSNTIDSNPAILPFHIYGEDRAVEVYSIVGKEQ